MGDVAEFIALAPQDRCERLLIQYAKRLIAAYDAPVEKVEDWHKKASAAMSNLRASCREHDRIVARSTTLDKG